MKRAMYRGRVIWPISVCRPTAVARLRRLLGTATAAVAAAEAGTKPAKIVQILFSAMGSNEEDQTRKN